jgi:hypothetical protein
MTTTDIYRIKTKNSVYEIQVRDQFGTTNRPSRCRKEGESIWRQVSDVSGAYLEKLCIGPGFDIPGVVDTSNVIDYVHFVLSTEPKRKAKGSATGIPEFFGMLAKEVVNQAKPKAFDRAKYQAHKDAAVALAERQPKWPCDVEGCTVDSPARHEGWKSCKSGSIASGGTRAHCTCDYCY